MEVLTAGARGVIVPFAADGQTEQTQRALRLAELGLLDVVPESALTPERLAAAVTRALARPEGIVPGLDVAGAGRTIDLLEAMIAGRHADVARA